MTYKTYDTFKHENSSFDVPLSFHSESSMVVTCCIFLLLLKIHGFIIQLYTFSGYLKLEYVNEA